MNLQLNECPQWVSDAKKLPPLSGTTAPAWWAVCKAALDEACPHIEERPEFDHINKGEAAYRRRAAIKDRLKRRIFSLLKK